MERERKIAVKICIMYVYTVLALLQGKTKMYYINKVEIKDNGTRTFGSHKTFIH